MPNKKNYSLKSWLLTRPALFAVITFAAMLISSMIGGLITNGNSMTITSIITVIAFLGSAAWLVRSLPGENLNRHSFVAINNAQTFITSIIFIASMLYIMANIQRLMPRLLWMETHSSAYFLIFLVILALFYLYLCGIYIANLYAKYRRVRAMGVSMWKILATAPFGFSMLWIPGYLMEDKQNTSKKATTEHGWYDRITDWIISRPTRAATTLVILIMLAGLTFGFLAVLLPLTMAVIFAAWSAITGMDKMRKNLAGVYSTTAIVINVVMIIGVLGYFAITYSHQHSPVETPAITQYVDTIEQQ